MAATTPLLHSTQINDSEHVGIRLRQAREQRGVAIESIASSLRIPASSLEAIESGDFRSLPNDVVVKGFLRNYALFLNLPPEEIIAQYRGEKGSTGQLRVVPVTANRLRRAYVFPSVVGVLFAVFMIVGLSYIALGATGNVSNNNVSIMAGLGGSPTATAASLTPEIPTAIVPASGITPLLLTPTSSRIITHTLGTPTPTRDAPIVVEVSIPASGKTSWLMVQTDGNTVYEQLMAPGETQTFDARRRIFIRAGNPTSVLVRVNGSSPERLGVIEGEPVDWSWPP